MCERIDLNANNLNFLRYTKQKRAMKKSLLFYLKIIF